MIDTQKTFVGGINLLAADTQLQDNEYRWLINARQRLGYIEANNKALEVDAPAGLKQGIRAVGDVLIVFVAGKAYYKKDGDTIWTQIAGFDMDPVADLYYTEVVPASTFNFMRKLDQSLNSPMIVLNDFKVSGTPAGIIVQDGAHQPYIIIYDQPTQTFIARETKKYSDWSNNTVGGREYVPIGKQMLWTGTILMIVSTDRKSVYRSVSGRPLDFMINVDAEGNKLASEAQGGAASVSFSFDSDEITNISPVNIPDSFAYCTARRVRIITADYTNTIFGEPTFIRSGIIEGGVVNHQSFIEVLGDYCFVDTEGVKTFNAVLQLRFEGRNSMFSLQLAKLLKGIKQTDSVCIEFDNYSIFDLKTTWGRMCCIYDSLIDKWVAFDIIAGVGRIKQFTTIETTAATKLFCISARDKVFQLYTAPEKEVAILKTKSSAHPEPKYTIKSQNVHLYFTAGPLLDGKVFVTEYVDGKQCANGYLDKTIEAEYAGVAFPVRCPVIPSTKILVKKLTFAFPDANQGKKVDYVIKWNTDARLVESEIITTDIGLNQTPQQSNKTAMAVN